MSARLRTSPAPRRRSGLVRHANAAPASTQAAVTALRVTLILLLAALLHHWVAWLLGWAFISAVITVLYTAGLLGLT